jgi:hypothetical protein
MFLKISSTVSAVASAAIWISRFTCTAGLVWTTGGREPAAGRRKAAHESIAEGEGFGHGRSLPASFQIILDMPNWSPTFSVAKAWLVRELTDCL